MAFGFGFGMPRSFAVPPFSPASLFATGAPGAWYDPSDRTTLFQDSAGTTPVTAVEQPVGLMLDKSQGLVLGPTLVTNGDLSDGTTGWTAVRSTLSASSGALVVTGSGTYPGVYQSFSTTAGKTYKVAIDVVSMGTSTTVRFAPKNGIGDGGTSLAVVDFTTTGSKSAVFTAIGGASTVFVLAEQNAVVNFSIDNISVRELPGNHAFQSTAASRPVLSARYNLLTKTEQFDDAAWSKLGCTATAGRIVASAGAGNHYLRQTIPSTVTIATALTIEVKRDNYDWLFIGPSDSFLTYFNTATGAFGNLGAGVTSTASVLTSDGYWQLTINTASAALSNYCAVGLAGGNGVTGFTATGTEAVLVRKASLVPANQSSLPYQRVNTATDYNTVGFLPYLKFDGVDDSLSTNSINFTSTDKMSVFAGVRKLSEVGAIIAELSVASATNNGSFTIFNSPSNTPGYGWQSSGTIRASAEATSGYAVPITNTLTGLGDISGDRATLRINGTQVAQSTTDQGTGNYGNYPLYIGRRGGTTLPFNGQLYSMIIVGKAVTAGELSSSEAYVNQKTGAY